MLSRKILFIIIFLFTFANVLLFLIIKNKGEILFMISIIVSIRNQYAMNSLFLESLKKYTYHPFEIIVIDNGSTDNSVKLFESFGAKVIRNKENYSYPYCQNQGVKIAEYDLFAFFNNDIIVSKDWDKILVEKLKQENLDVAGFGCNDSIEKYPDTRPLKRRWKHFKNLLLTVFGFGKFSLKTMFKFMYGDWDKCIERWNKKYQGVVREGISGSCVMMTRRGYDLLDGWDERIQAADFDIYMKTKERSQMYGDIRPAHNIMEIYIHHYGRLTLKKDYVPFKDLQNIISVKEKWGDKYDDLLKDLSHEGEKRKVG